MRKIAIGSKNPAKIKALKNVVKKIWPKAKVVAIKVPSGVKEQPTSEKEAIKGAFNRAKLSLQRTKADFGIGIEGCTVENRYGTFLSGWVVAIDKKRKIGMGGGGRLLLPKKMGSEIKKGKELGPIADKFSGIQNVKQKQGVIGVLTNGLISRAKATEWGIIYALTKFINPNNYK